MSEPTPVGPDPSLIPHARKLREDFDRLVMEHEFGIDEVRTKVSILQREFLHLHHYNPIEHVASRVKSMDSILAKLVRKGLDPSPEAARAHLTDIAGLRVTCSFIADTYRVLDTLTTQNDLTVVEIKDYIARPKPNGYRSLHVIVAVPVFLSDGPLPVTVEVQLRTVAMDFWASLEHKIHYKYDGEVPATLLEDLTETAHIAQELDLRMERLHQSIHGPGLSQDSRSDQGDIEATIMTRMWESMQRRIAEEG